MSKSKKDPKRVTMATIKAWLRRQAKGLPQETRQKILDLMWEGVAVEEITGQTGASADQVRGVYELNIKTVKILRKESL